MDKYKLHVTDTHIHISLYIYSYEISISWDEGHLPSPSPLNGAPTNNALRVITAGEKRLSIYFFLSWLFEQF